MTNLSYSARIDISLHIDDQVLPIWEVGPDFVVAKNPIILPPCEGTLVVMVDDERFESTIRLVNGMSPTTPRTLMKTVAVATANSPA